MSLGRDGVDNTLLQIGLRGRLGGTAFGLRPTVAVDRRGVARLDALRVSAGGWFRSILAAAAGALAPYLLCPVALDAGVILDGLAGAGVSRG